MKNFPCYWPFVRGIHWSPVNSPHKGQWRVIIQSVPFKTWYNTTRYWHDDVIQCKHFPRYWPFVRGIHRSPVNSTHTGQWRGALMFSLICVLNKRLSKRSWGWWFETPPRSLWRHCNDTVDHWSDFALTKKGWAIGCLLWVLIMIWYQTCHDVTAPCVYSVLDSYLLNNSFPGKRCIEKLSSCLMVLLISSALIHSRWLWHYKRRTISHRKLFRWNVILGKVAQLLCNKLSCYLNVSFEWIVCIWWSV